MVHHDDRERGRAACQPSLRGRNQTNFMSSTVTSGHRTGHGHPLRDMSCPVRVGCLRTCPDNVRVCPACPGYKGTPRLYQGSPKALLWDGEVTVRPNGVLMAWWFGLVCVRFQTGKVSDARKSFCPRRYPTVTRCQAAQPESRTNSSFCGLERLIATQSLALEAHAGPPPCPSPRAVVATHTPSRNPNSAPKKTELFRLLHSFFCCSLFARTTLFEALAWRPGHLA